MKKRENKIKRYDIRDVINGKVSTLPSVPEGSVAILASAIRTHLWMDTYNFIKETNKTPFIMIFCGHVKPDFELPDNFMYIYSEMQPAACHEICIRVSYQIQGVKYLMNIADDCFWPDKMLDTLVSEYEKNSVIDNNLMVAPGFLGDEGGPMEQIPCRYHTLDPTSPELPLCALMSLETSKILGSIDKGFIGQYWDCDRSMRFHQIKGTVKILDHDKFGVLEMHPSKGSHLLAPRCYNHDRGFLDRLWTQDKKGGTCTTERSQEVNPYYIQELTGHTELRIPRKEDVKKEKNKTIIVAPAIKTKFWKKFYLNLCRSKIPFHLVFVGHIKPDFTLPSNFTYIYCNESPSKCAEIAFRYAYDNILDAEYIMNIADDVEIPEYFLDNLVKFYKDKKEITSSDFLCVSPIFQMTNGQENLMSLYQGGPLLLGPMFTTVENSKKIGGVDKEFKAIYWDCDRHLRAHFLGAELVCASANELAPIREIEFLSSGGLWNTYGKDDKSLLDNMWEINAGGQKEVMCSSLERDDRGILRNNFHKKRLILKRKRKVFEYDREELKGYYE